MLGKAHPDGGSKDAAVDAIRLYPTRPKRGNKPSTQQRLHHALLPHSCDASMTPAAAAAAAACSRAGPWRGGCTIARAAASEALRVDSLRVDRVDSLESEARYSSLSTRSRAARIASRPASPGALHPRVVARRERRRSSRLRAGTRSGRKERRAGCVSRRRRSFSMLVTGSKASCPFCRARSSISM